MALNLSYLSDLIPHGHATINPQAVCCRLRCYRRRCHRHHYRRSSRRRCHRHRRNCRRSCHRRSRCHRHRRHFHRHRRSFRCHRRRCRCNYRRCHSRKCYHQQCRRRHCRFKPVSVQSSLSFKCGLTSAVTLITLILLQYFPSQISAFDRSQQAVSATVLYILPFKKRLLLK